MSDGSPKHKSPIGLQKQPIQASTPVNPLVTENRFFNPSIQGNLFQTVNSFGSFFGLLNITF